MGRVISLALVRAGKASGKELSEVLETSAIELDHASMPVADRVLVEVQREHAIKGAAWLVRMHRKKLVRGKAVEFKIGQHETPQKFFYPALHILEERPQSWEVKRSKIKRGRARILVFRIRWIGYRKSITTS